MTSSVNSPESWLENQLLGLKDVVPFLDEVMVSGLVSYCPHARDEEVEVYLKNIMGESDRVQAIAAGYIQQRASQTPGERTTNKILTAGRMAAEEGMQAYVKPRTDETVPSRPQTQAKPAQARPDPSQKQAQKRQEKRASKKGQSVQLSGLSEVEKFVFSRGGPCDCEASKHRLVTNCLKCGKIVCEKEGEGPCSFCGHLVLAEGSQFGGEEGGTNLDGVSEDEIRAVEFKNRLVEYDRTAARRTAVIDDQSDYFAMEGDKWMSEEEKERLRKQREKERMAEEEKRRKIVVTFDLLGRKVVLNKDDEASTSFQSSFLASLESQETTTEARSNFDTETESQNRVQTETVPSKSSPSDFRMKPNPNLKTPSPVFLNPKPQKGKPLAKKETPKRTQKGGNSSTDAMSSGSTKRTGEVQFRVVQHDDPLVEAVIGGALDQPIGNGYGGGSTGWDGTVISESSQECG